MVPKQHAAWTAAGQPVDEVIRRWNAAAATGKKPWPFWDRAGRER